jgi:hypothetical protein
MRDRKPVFQEFDRERSLIGQTLKCDPSYGSSHFGKPFMVESMGYQVGWYRDPDTIHVTGHVLRKDGTVGQNSGETELALNDVPTVDLDRILRAERNRAVKDLRHAFTKHNRLKNVLTERKVKLLLGDLEVDALIQATIEAHQVSASSVKDDDD